MQKRCLKCECDYDNTLTKCPDCGNNEWEEVEDVKCTECDFIGYMNVYDGCPKCEGELTEYF